MELYGHGSMIHKHMVSNIKEINLFSRRVAHVIIKLTKIYKIKLQT